MSTKAVTLSAHQAALARLGRLALEATELDWLLDETASLVAQILDVEYCKILELLPGGESLMLRAGVGWKEHLVGTEVAPFNPRTLSGYALTSLQPVVVEDFATERQLQRSRLLEAHGIASGAHVVIPGADPFGVLAVNSATRRKFTPAEVAFLEAAAEVLGHAIQRHRSHEAVRQSEERLRRAFDEAPIGIAILGRNRRFIQANRLMCEHFAYTEPELRERTLEDLVAPVDAPRTAELLKNLWDGDISHFHRDCRGLSKRGEYLLLDLTVTLVRDDEGSPLHALVMVEDQTARWQCERELHLARFTLDHAREIIYWAGAGGRILDANQAASQILGYSPQELRSLSVADIDTGVTADSWPTFWEDGKRKAAVTRETELCLKDGNRIPVEVTTSYLEFQGSEFQCSMARDIRERKRLEEQLRASEERHRALIDHALDLTTVLDAEGRVRYVSPAIQRLLGYAVEERLGRSALELIHPEDQPKVRSALEEGVKKTDAAATIEFRIRHKNGSWRVFEAIARNLLGNSAVRGIVVHSRDITQRKLADEIRRAGQEWFRSSFQNAGVPTAITGLDGRWLRVNPAMCQFLGYSEQELLRLRWQDVTHPEDLSVINAGRARLLAGEIPAFHQEKRYLHKSGKILWGHLTLSLIRDARERPHSFTVQVVDITKRKEAEEAYRKTEAALRRSEGELRGLAARLLGNEDAEHRRLARELHDDFSQRLAVVAFELARLEKDILCTGTPQFENALRSLREKIDALSDDMRGLARQLHPAVVEVLGLPAALRELCHNACIPERCAVRFTARRLPRTLPPTLSVTLYRVVQEALRNIARHSGASRVAVTLRASGRSVWLTIRDNGVGFDPSESAKGGIGLISMKERVRLINGMLSVESKPQRGTRITVHVPHALEEGAAAPQD